MGRLIDASNLNFNNQKYNKSQMKAILDFVDSQPTAYDADKVVKKLTEAKTNCKNSIAIYDTKNYVKLEKAIEIVKGAVKDE